MSLISDELAVISIGMSCQTAWQINQSLELVRDLTGDASFKNKRLPFDWLAAPASSILANLEENVFLPPREEVSMKRNHVPHWERFDVYYWHDFQAERHGPFLIDETFDTVVEKYRHIDRNWRSLQSKRRVMAIFSNTQNNIAPPNVRSFSLPR